MNKLPDRAWVRASLIDWIGRERGRKLAHARAQAALDKARAKDVHPREHLVAERDRRSDLLEEARDRIALRRNQLEKIDALHDEGNAWGGCRRITNRMIRIVGERARVTSRKRSETYGNPGSDHHISQKRADAVDFGIANAYALADEIARELGGPSDIDDYENFVIEDEGDRFRIQLIAGTHGTGPHLHGGVLRV